MNGNDLQSMLCKALCAEAVVTTVRDGFWRVATPFHFPDGDAYTLYVQQVASGGLRISDAGSTMMRLSYENDIEKLREGTRGRFLQQVLSDSDMQDDDGEFFVDSSVEDLAKSMFRFGQGLTRIHDLTFLNRLRAESTFYEDLRETLQSMVLPELLHEAFVVTDVPRAADYPVDYFVETQSVPLYLFGVPNRDKARLATIILQHLIQSGQEFNSMIVFQNMSDLPRADISRLTNAANDQVDSLDAVDDLRRKLLRRVR
jgi:hypothetical protein